MPKSPGDRPMDVPDADAQEQSQDWAPEPAPQEPHIDVDVPEADALEQAQPVDLDEDEYR